MMLPRHQALTNQPKPPNHCPTAEFVETIQTHTFVQRLKDLSGCRRTKFIHTHMQNLTDIFEEKQGKKKQAPTNRVPKADRKSAKTKKPTSTTRIQDKATNTRLHSESSQHAPRRIKDFTQKHRSSPCFVHSRGQHFDLTLSQSLRQP